MNISGEPMEENAGGAVARDLAAPILMDERAGASKPSGMIHFSWLALLLLAFAPLAAAAPGRAAHQFSDPLVQKGFDHFYNVEYRNRSPSSGRLWKPRRTILAATITWRKPSCSA